MQSKFNLPLINAHCHAAMVGFRGMAEDLPLKEWLNNVIWPLEAKMVNPNFVYEQTKLAITEMKANGICAFMDMYFYEDEVARACEELEMPVVLGEGLIDLKGQEVFDKDLERTETLLEKYKNHFFIKVSVAPHSPYTVSKDNLIKAKELARKYNAVYQLHVAETKEEVDNSIKEHGLTPVEYLESIGVLDEKTVLIHCVWLSDNDILIIKNHDCKVVHCPLSNLKLGSGIASVDKLLKAGVIVALGTDGAASSNRLDIWEAGKFAALLQKGVNNDPTLLPVREVIRMMTVNGMKTMGFESVAGKKIEEIEVEIEKGDFSFLYD
ncbi:MAG: amidohydrolase [Candidatus Paceibacterota bacterium]|jgi:5-methylthioadenosine/S-adenosylhomocysteine deaminase